MGEWIEEYFVRPIIERTGYNFVNTLAYAAIALACLYIIWRLLRQRVDFSSKEFLFGVFAFVLFGSTARVVTDLSDAGAIALKASEAGALGAIYSAVSASRMFDYGFLTVTPGIYVVTALLFLLSLFLGRVMKSPMFPAYAGLALFLPCALLLLPFAAHFNYALLVLAIAAIGSFVAYFLLEKFGKVELGLHQKLAIFGQALDGAATFVVIDIFAKETGRSYFEQHVLSAGIGTATPLGFFLFFLIKLSLASLIVYFISKEKMDGKDMALILIVVSVMGFAPGIRDLLRMLAGT